METKFTPGPWTVMDGHYPSFKEISGPSFGITAVMWATDLTEDDYQKRYADLHLIAAAPDLYMVLEEVFDEVENYMERTGRSVTWGEKAKAALAKARGEA